MGSNPPDMVGRIPILSPKPDAPDVYPQSTDIAIAQFRYFLSLQILSLHIYSLFLDVNHLSSCPATREFAPLLDNEVGPCNCPLIIAALVYNYHGDKPF